MNRNTTIYLRDIIENMRLAEDFVQGMTYESFVSDPKTAYAVLRCLEVIGEAAKHVPVSIREQYPAVPWKDMAGMRDRVIHFYFGVSNEKIWHTIKDDLPTVRPLLEQIVKGGL